MCPTTVKPVMPLRSRLILGRGFTLIELMITMAIAGILVAVALPNYSRYVNRSRVAPALEALSTYAVRMEQRFQDVGNYGTGTPAACAVALPTVSRFTVTCALGTAATTYTATATGTDVMTGYTFTIDSNGTRVTTAHPGGVPATNCWTTRGGSCES